MVTISKEEYEQLVKDSQLLEALTVMGVDNWEGYSDAIESWEIENKRDIDELPA